MTHILKRVKVKYQNFKTPKIKCTKKHFESLRHYKCKINVHDLCWDIGRPFSMFSSKDDKFKINLHMTKLYGYDRNDDGIKLNKRIY